MLTLIIFFLFPFLLQFVLALARNKTNQTSNDSSREPRLVEFYRLQKKSKNKIEFLKFQTHKQCPELFQIDFNQIANLLDSYVIERYLSD